MIEYLAEKFNFVPEAKHHNMTALEYTQWISENCKVNLDIVYFQFYKFYGWSDRMAKVKTREALETGCLY